MNKYQNNYDYFSNHLYIYVVVVSFISLFKMYVYGVLEGVLDTNVQIAYSIHINL